MRGSMFPHDTPHLSDSPGAAAPPLPLTRLESACWPACARWVQELAEVHQLSFPCGRGYVEPEARSRAAVRKGRGKRPLIPPATTPRASERRSALLGRAPKEYSDFWKSSTPHIWITIGCTTQNSSDLSLGRRPDSKSDEFSSCTPMVDQIFMFLGLKPLKSCYTVWEHDPLF